jgi:cysteine desulfurase family protein (TIGR01976 family)
VSPSWDVEAIRTRFPSLRRAGPDGQAVAWLDGPAGTQVVDLCLRAMNDYLLSSNANRGGAFAASLETDELVAGARAAAADLIGAADVDEVSFGPNMTTITFALSRAIGARLQPGDAIVLTRLDHDANVAPWLAVAEERRLEVRWVGLRDDLTLELTDLEQALDTGRVRLVAVGLASNAVGTINPIPAIAALTRAAGAQLWVDAVHAAPHLALDVAALGADFLVWSAYKVYGPHLGVLWGRREVMDDLPHHHVRPAGDAIPGRFETGTQAHELLAGLLGTVTYLEQVGVAQGGASGDPGTQDGRRRARLLAAMSAVRRYESGLVERLIDRVGHVRGLHVRGITDPSRTAERCPTIAFTIEGWHPRHVARHLAERGLHTWDGDYYAWELIRALGLAEEGGMLRVGLVHYNSAAEVDRLGDALDELVAA